MRAAGAAATAALAANQDAVDGQRRQRGRSIVPGGGIERNAVRWSGRIGDQAGDVLANVIGGEDEGGRIGRG